MFGFDQLSFLDDLANYKDPIHYHPVRNSEFLMYMKNGQYILTISNIDFYVKNVTQLAKKYDVFLVAKKIKNYYM